MQDLRSIAQFYHFFFYDSFSKILSSNLSACFVYFFWRVNVEMKQLLMFFFFTNTKQLKTVGDGKLPTRFSNMKTKNHKFSMILFVIFFYLHHRYSWKCKFKNIFKQNPYDLRYFVAITRSKTKHLVTVAKYKSYKNKLTNLFNRRNSDTSSKGKNQMMIFNIRFQII